MSNSNLEIEAAVTAPVLEALRDISVRLTALKIPYVLIGAVARDIIAARYGEASKRMTYDLDLAIIVESDQQYLAAKTTLVDSGKYTADTKEEQRVLFGGVMKVDLVPFGAIAGGSGKVHLPPSRDFVLNVRGFQEAFDAAEMVALDSKNSIRVVTVEGLVVLKLIAWNDRPNERQRDVEDITFIFSKYLKFVPGTDEYLFEKHSDILKANGHDIDLASIQLLGNRVAKGATTETRAVLTAMFETETRQNTFVAGMVPGASSDRSVDQAREKLNAFIRGLNSV